MDPTTDAAPAADLDRLTVLADEFEAALAAMEAEPPYTPDGKWVNVAGQARVAERLAKAEEEYETAIRVAGRDLIREITRLRIEHENAMTTADVAARRAVELRGELDAERGETSSLRAALADHVVRLERQVLCDAIRAAGDLAAEAERERTDGLVRAAVAAEREVAAAIVRAERVPPAAAGSPAISVRQHNEILDEIAAAIQARGTT